MDKVLTCDILGMKFKPSQVRKIHIFSLSQSKSLWLWAFFYSCWSLKQLQRLARDKIVYTMHIQSSHFQWVVFFHPKGVAKNGTPTHIHLAPRKEGPGWYIFVTHIRSMQCQCCIEATFLLASKHHFKRCQLFWGVNIRLEVFWIYCTY